MDLRILGMSHVLTDIIHAARSLYKSPALTAVAIASLALGIGANITIYSVVREMILDDMSALQPDRLARIDAKISYATYRDLRRAGVFHDLAFETGLFDMNWNIGAQNSAAIHNEIAWEMSTSANFFDVLGVRAALGHLYSQVDESRQVAVVSHGFWLKRLHSDPNIIGRPLQFNGRFYTILGVLPRDYRSILGHGLSPEVYRLARTDSTACRPFGRLRDGFTREQTRQALLAAARVIGDTDFAKQVSILRPMAGLAAHENDTGDDRRYFLFFVTLLGTALMLAIIACFNVAGLLLARGVSRQRELAIRRALGANRLQLARHLLGEGFVLVVLGAGVGLIIDAFLRGWLSFVRWPSAYNLPFEFHFQTDRGLFLYALTAALTALLVSSLLPSLRGANADLGLALKQGEPPFSIRRWNLRNSFVAMQVALSMVLLMLGAIFFRGFAQVSNVDPGFDVSHTVIAIVYSRDHRGESSWSWRDRLVRRMKELPGVIGVTSIGTLPFMGELPQEPIRRNGDAQSSAHNAYSVGAGDEFCKVLAIPILRGRDFEIADRSRQPAPALVNQTLARRLFGNADPIGAQLVVGHEKEQVLEIIGVTADAKMRTLGEDHAPVFFTPFSDAQLLVRVAGNPTQWVKPVQNVLAEMDPISAIAVRPLSDAAAGAIFPMRVAAGFVGSLSALGLLLVLTGLYSSVSYATRRRTREMAIRAAVGAPRSAILWSAIRDGIAVLACGVALGLPLAIAAIRPLTGILPDRVNPWDSVMFLAVCILLLATGAGAAFLPARFAANVDPSHALRQE
jgi:putative ABC transport system permease protein